MSGYIGLKLGNYRITRLLGQGGFAHVYLGEHIYLKTPAAIKVLQIQLANDTLESFLKEARTIARLEHPHIIRVLEFGREQITPFLVMSYAENGTLRQRYPRKSTLPWKEIVSYARQIADALQYAHDQGVIHRDVKPENMLLRKNKEVQLSDFGLAVIAHSISVDVSTRDTRAGTTAYMAPEQIQGRPDRASDQYALGIVVYEWFCGSWPFTGTEREITVQQLYTPPPSLCAKVPAITVAIEKVVMKALAKEPQERFASVQEFALSLEEACMQASLQEVNEGTRTVFFASDSASSQEAISHISSEAPTQELPAQLQGPDGVSLSLPLSDDEAIFTGQARISQPSLDLKSLSLREPSLQLPAHLQAQDIQAAPQLLHSTVPVVQAAPSGTDTPRVGFIPDRRWPLAKQPGVIAQQAQTTRTSQEAVQQVTSQPSAPSSADLVIRQRYKGNRIIVALGISILIALLLLTGVLAWPHFTQDKQTIHSSQQPGSPVAVRNTATAGVSPPSAANKPGASAPDGATQSGGVPTVQATPKPIAPTQPGVTATPVPTNQATPTPLPPLAVAITSAPTSAAGGTMIAITTQANQGRVTIALNGKVRKFGEQIADNQGVAIFEIRVPIKGKAIFLTATATDQNGNQAVSLTWTITVT